MHHRIPLTMEDTDIFRVLCNFTARYREVMATSWKSVSAMPV